MRLKMRFFRLTQTTAQGGTRSIGARQLRHDVAGVSFLSKKNAYFLLSYKFTNYDDCLAEVSSDDTTETGQ